MIITEKGKAPEADGYGETQALFEEARRRRRRRWILGWVVVLVVGAAAFTVSQSESRAKRAPRAQSSSPPATLFSSPGSPDPRCNGGHPLYLGGSSNGPPNIYLTAAETNGITLVGVPSRSGRHSALDLYALNRNCSPYQGFGIGGVVKLPFPMAPSEVEPINAITAERNGDILLAGGSRGYPWTVGRLLPDGHIDEDFGTKGWVALTSSHWDSGSVNPAATSIAETGTGTIVVAGNDGAALCCSRAYVFEITSTGQVNDSFGQDGSIEVLPQGQYLPKVDPQPSGDIGVTGVDQGMECGATSLSMLDSSGQVLPTEERNLTEMAQQLRPTQFFAGTGFQFADGSFGLAGTGGENCDLPLGPRRGFGVVEQILPNGTLDPSYGSQGHAYFRAIQSIKAWAVPTHDGGVVVVSEEFGSVTSNSTLIQLTSVSPQGLLDRGFRGQGQTKLVMPSQFSGDEAVTIGPRGDIVLVLG
jgi:hypothetical protein